MTGTHRPTNDAFGWDQFNQAFNRFNEWFGHGFPFTRRTSPLEPGNDWYRPPFGMQPPSTPMPPSPPSAPPPSTQVPVPTFDGRPPRVDYRTLNTDQRMSLSNLNAQELGYLHVGGRGLAFTGSREGIYQSYWTVLDALERGDTTISERDRAAVLGARNEEQRLGLASGSVFERSYLAALDKASNSQAFSAMAQGQPPVQDTGKRLQVPNTIAPDSEAFVAFQRQQGNPRANFANLMILTGWNHDPLDNGIIDGSIYAHELASQQAGTALVRSPEAQRFNQLMAENELVDGQFNNTTGTFFAKAFESAYLGTAPVSLQDIERHTAEQAQALGRSQPQVKDLVQRTVSQLLQSGQQGVLQGLRDFKDSFTQQPLKTATTLGGMTLASVCPYLAALPALGRGTQNEPTLR